MGGRTVDADGGGSADQSQCFRALLRGKLRKVTIAADTVFIGAPVLLGLIVYLIDRNWPATLVVTALVSLVMLMSFIFLARQAPRGYCIVDSGVKIRRGARDILIPISDITSVDRCSREEVWNGADRLNAGTYRGAWGLFSNYAMHGDFLAYVTDCDSMVMLRRSCGPPVVISPEEPDRFVDAVSALR